MLSICHTIFLYQREIQSITYWYFGFLAKKQEVVLHLIYNASFPWSHYSPPGPLVHLLSLYHTAGSSSSSSLVSVCSPLVRKNHIIYTRYISIIWNSIVTVQYGIVQYKYCIVKVQYRYIINSKSIVLIVQYSIVQYIIMPSVRLSLYIQYASIFTQY